MSALELANVVAAAVCLAMPLAFVWGVGGLVRRRLLVRAGVHTERAAVIVSMLVVAMGGAALLWMLSSMMRALT